MTKDYYKILGVDKGASQKEIKSAYRKLAMKYHPDQNKGDAAAEEQFKKISEAYAVLSDPEKRKKYDMFGDEKFRQQYTSEDIFGGSNINDILREFGFGGFRGGGFRSRGGFGFGESPFEQEMVNLDVTSSMEITLEESVKGGERQVTLQSGSKKELINVKIPPGIREGGKLRLPGKGQSDRNRKGDLFIEIKIAKHPTLKRKDDDLTAHANIPLSTALLGGTIEIETLDGTKSVKIPAGTGFGQKIRIKGAGVKALNRSHTGDLYIEIGINIPKEMTDSQKKAVEELQKSGL